MSITAHANSMLASLFSPVSLEALNSKASMLERLDNKYVVEAGVLRQAAADFSKHFDVLEIGGLRDFTYVTCYFDSESRQSYLDHHQGRRQRVKVRMRKYIDAGLCFIEVKLKDKRGITIKKRLPVEMTRFGELDAPALDFVHSIYRDHYGRSFPYELSRVADMQYTRATLVAKQGGERMTIDSRLQFIADGTSHAVDPSIYILETKSANGNGLADTILRRFHQHPTKHCSKYCASIAVTHKDFKHNRFLPVLRKLGSFQVPVGATI